MTNPIQGHEVLDIWVDEWWSYWDDALPPFGGYGEMDPKILFGIDLAKSPIETYEISAIDFAKITVESNIRTPYDYHKHDKHRLNRNPQRGMRKMQGYRK